MNNPDMASRYVEVIGEASYEEPIEFFHATVVLEVRATKEESAMEQLAALVRRCVDELLAGGMSRDELEDAGVNLARPWWVRRKDKEVGKTATHRLLLKCADLRRANSALGRIESVAANTRESVDIQMQPPTFRTDESLREDAMPRAVAAARRSASNLAEAGGARVGQIMRIEEATAAFRHSGFSGDNDWMGDCGRFAAAGGAGAVMASVAEQPAALPTPSRTIWVRCRVRFEILPATP